jgi:predicted PurR-regulated permease PerM
LETIRKNQQKGYPLELTDPKPITDVSGVWRSAAQFATVGIFLIALGVVLEIARPILLPVMSAIIIGMMFGPLVSRAAKFGIPSGVTAVVILLMSIGALYGIVELVSLPVTQWAADAPKIADSMRGKLEAFNKPLTMLQDLRKAIAPEGADKGGLSFGVMDLLQPAALFVTPALGQMVIFFGTLFFFLLGRAKIRKLIVVLFDDREDRLRSLRILNDIERNLTGYLSVVSVIFLCMGLITVAISYAVGLPSPWTWGALAFILNFIPYVGAIVMVLILFLVSLITFPTIGAALLAPALYIAAATLEGHFVTPSIVGKHLTLGPLTVFLTLVFWTWLWGPVGAFLAVPILIVFMVAFNHLFPKDESVIPG